MFADELAARGVLGIGPDADRAEARRAFRVRAREHHPDRHRDASPAARARHAAAFAEALAAWELLSGERMGASGPGAPVDLDDFGDLDDLAASSDLDLDAGLPDDEPLTGVRPGCFTIALPLVLAVVAAAVFMASVLFEARPLWQAAFALAVASAAAFVLAPFFTMLRSRR